MRSSSAFALLALLAHGSVTGAGAAEDVPNAEPKALRSVGAWVTYWDFARGLDRLAAAPGAVDEVFLFLGDLGADGRPAVAATELSAERAARTLSVGNARAWLTVVNDRRGPAGRAALKDPDLVHGLLADTRRRTAHRHDLLALASANAVGGLDVDYENLRVDDRELFTTFVRELGSDAKARGLALSVTVQPKTQESRSTGPGAADWAALCGASDRLQIMLYNLHNAKTGPGPLATKSWISSVLSFATSQCDRARVVPVLKLGAMDWGPDGFKELQYSDLAERLGAVGAETVQRDPDGGSPFFRYDAPEGAHTVYFEDATSVLEKVAWIQSLGFDSIVLWSVGREDPQILPGLLARKNYQTRISSAAPTPQPE